MKLLKDDAPLRLFVESLRKPAPGEERTGLQTGWSGFGWDPANPAPPPPNLGGSDISGVAITWRTAVQVAEVLSCLRIISGSLTKLGNPVAYKQEFDPTTKHTYRVALEKQPAILTNTWGELFQFDGLERTVISMALYGEAFWYVAERDRLGYPSAISVLNPLYMSIADMDPKAPSQVNVGAEGAWVAPDKYRAYWYGMGEQRRQLETDDVIHIPFRSVPGGSRGLSSLDYARVNLALAIAAREYGSRYFGQGASPAWMFSTDQKLGIEEIERIADKFQVEHAGLTRAHLPLIIDSGVAVSKLSSTPDEAQFLQTLNSATRTIGAWFGVPPHLLGIEDRSLGIGRTFEEALRSFATFTLSGYLTRLDEAFSSLLPRGTLAAFDRHKLTEPDAQSLAALLLNMRQTQVATINDVRVRILGWEPVEGGDDLLAPLASNVAPSQTPSQTFSDVDADAGKRQQTIEVKPTINVDARQNPPVVNVDARQEPPVVNIEPTAIPAPEVRVDAPVVNVEAPPPAEVKVEPHIEVKVPKPKAVRVKRDPRSGRITGTEPEPEEG